MTSKNIVLVCSHRSHAAEGRLRAAGCKVTKVADGRAAVSLTKRYGFDAAVLISTGTEMDVTETALNLRDVNPPMPIFIIADKSESGRKLLSRSHVAALIPKTITLGIRELANYLAASDLESAPLKKGIG
jgi:DNA-binding response OmpR family regulator